MTQAAPEMPVATATATDGLVAQGLERYYGRWRVVSGVDVNVRRGEVVGLLGPNGAGKSTTFHMIVGLLRPNAGRILLDGRDITMEPVYRRARLGLGYLSQEPSIFRRLTVRENVLAVLETMPLSKADRESRLGELLEDLNLTHLSNRHAHKLSGGERRRVEITRSLARQPSFMLLDEPFVGIDPIAVEEIQAIIARLRARGLGVLITDHNVRVTLNTTDRSYIMFDGRIQLAGLRASWLRTHWPASTTSATASPSRTGTAMEMRPSLHLQQQPVAHHDASARSRRSSCSRCRRSSSSRSSSRRCCRTRCSRRWMTSSTRRTSSGGLGGRGEQQGGGGPGRGGSGRLVRVPPGRPRPHLRAGQRAGHRVPREGSRHAPRRWPRTCSSSSTSSSLPEESVRIAEFLIGSIDDRGWLVTPLEEVASMLGVPLETVEKVLAVVQALEPAGVGARDLRECLLIQLEARGDRDSLSWKLIHDHFDHLVNRRFPEIARVLKVTPEEVQAGADVIATLNPRPGTAIAEDDARYVTPDLLVERVDDEYVVMLNDRHVPRLRISSAYESVIRGKKKPDATTSEKETRTFIKDQLASAKWLIQTIEQRRRTMIKVMKCIIREQREFFDKGIAFLRPLTLAAVARQIDMHESTVSRVCSAKYVQTPRGVFELKFFFSSGLETDDGEDVSARTAKDIIRTLIDEEDKTDPLSDQRIAEMLHERGLHIARRTVAKYREQLSILPARFRRRVA